MKCDISNESSAILQTSINHMTSVVSQEGHREKFSH